MKLPDLLHVPRLSTYIAATSLPSRLAVAQPTKHTVRELLDDLDEEYRLKGSS